MSIDEFKLLLGAVVILIALFFVLREVVLWYFKLNQIATDLHYIAECMREERGEAERQPSPSASASSSQVNPLPRSR